MYTSEELFAILTRRVSENRPHRDYERTVTHAKWCKQMMTGDDQRDILVTYKVRETEKQMQQRVRITNSRSQYVCNKVLKLYNEVHRCDEVTESVSYEGQDQTRTQTLMSALDKFYENKPLKNYLNNRFRNLAFYDPNAYVVIEFENDDPVNRKPTVYPFEVASHEVYDQGYTNGVLQYVVSQHQVSYKSKAATKKETIGKKYTMYGIGYSFILQHIPKDAVYGEIPEGYTELNLKVRQDNDRYISERFIFQAFETKTVECQAYRAGWMDDPVTNGRTKVSAIYPAEKILTDLIWNKSEYDLSKALHGFYQKFTYVSKCETCHGDGEYEGKTCRSCKGTGKSSHSTVQDIVEITMPDGDNLPPLSNFVYYATIPEHLINKQKADYESDQRDVFNAIFGSNVLDRTELVETATAKHYDWRAVNNTLSEYADHRSEAYEFFVRMSASHLMQLEGLQVQHSYPSDFKLESIQDLLDQRASAINAGAPMQVVSYIDQAILAKQHRDNPEYLAKYKARERFRPMRDKSKEERQLLISMLPSDDFERVLYIYFERIMDEIFDEYPNFADTDFKKQWAIVTAKVDARRVSMRPVTMSAVIADPIEDDEPEPMEQ